MLNHKTNERELAYIVKVAEAKDLEGYDRVHSCKVHFYKSLCIVK